MTSPPVASQADNQQLSILWIKAGNLLPLNTGGRKRTHSMLRQLSEQHHVCFLGLLPENSELSDAELEDSYAAEKHWVSLREPTPSSAEFFLDLARNLLFSNLPYSLDKYRSRELENAILELCEQNEFDLLVCDFLTPAPNIQGLDLPFPVVLFQHNMESEIWRRMTANKKNPVSRLYFHWQYQRMFEAEQRLSRIFDGVITVSPNDTAFSRDVYRLTNVLGDVPTGVDTDYFSPATEAQIPGDASSERLRIGFLGSMDWMPNIEAVQWFIDQIFPQILATQPEAEFCVIGRNPPAALVRYAEDTSNVIVTGTVDDVRPHLQGCDIIAVPLLSGGGTRIKILEVMAMGLPVVSTEVGAEGLGLKPGEHICIADEADSIAAAISDLLDDSEARTQLGERGRQQVATYHTWQSATDTFVSLCQRSLNEHNPATHSGPA